MAFRKFAAKAPHLLIFPKNQIYCYLRSGKFKSLSKDWKHEKMPLEFDYEMIVVTEGTLFLRYMDEDFTVSTGNYLILPPSTSSRIGFKKAYCSFYWIHFTADLGLFPARVDSSSIGSYKRGNCFLMPQTGIVPKLEKMIVQMKQLQDLERNNYPDIALNASTTAIITELYGQLQIESSLEKNPLGNNQIYSDIADYIRSNITKNIKISEIAEEFGYSPKYLSNLFSKVQGISLKQFIIQQKIETACYYLTDSDKTITEISAELGFSDMHNFSRTFKNVIGLPPKVYRNTYAKRLLYHE